MLISVDHGNKLIKVLHQRSVYIRLAGERRTALWRRDVEIPREILYSF